MKLILQNCSLVYRDLVIPDAIKPALLAYGDISSEKKAALISIYNALNTAGLWSRITELYLPIVANTVATSFINAKDGVVDMIPDSTQAEMTSQGIKGVVAGQQTSGASTGKTVNCNLINKSFIAVTGFSQNQRTVPIKPVILDGSTFTLEVQWFREFGCDMNLNIFSGLATPARLGVSTDRTNTTFGFVITDATNYWVCNDTKTRDESLVSGKSFSGRSVNAFFPIGGRSVCCTSPVQMVIVADAISKAEYETLRSICYNFVDSIIES